MIKCIKGFSIIILFLSLACCSANKLVLKDIQPANSQYKDVEFPEDDELDDLPESEDEDEEKM